MRRYRVASLDLNREKPFLPDVVDEEGSFSQYGAKRLETHERRRKAGRLFAQMSTCLSRILNAEMSMPSLISFAELIATEQRLHIDGSARRFKDALICWFCEVGSTGVQQPTETIATKEQLDSEVPAKATYRFESLLTALEEEELRNGDWFEWESDNSSLVNME
jgi:hypothetical protein